MSLASIDLPAPDPAPEARSLVQALPACMSSVWKGLHWENSWKEVWWRFLQHGVVCAGGHGWAPARGWKCKCGWEQGAPSTLRAVQLWEHIFWGCVGAQEVRGVLQGVALLPKHVWLLEPPAPTIDPIICAAVGIAALTVMLTVSKQLRSGVGESQARGLEALAHTRAFVTGSVLCRAVREQ